MKKLLIASFVVVGLMCGAFLARAKANPTKTPVLVELFTSEGCSSCPPVDAWLNDIDRTQPLPDAQLIVLSEHVDYWNHDGWKDPYSSHLLTERQSDYERSLRVSEPFTPQVVVDGTGQPHFNSPQQVEQVFKSAVASAKIPIAITALTINSSGIHMHLNVNGENASHGAEVFVAIALSHAESQVSRGENSGRHLVHTAVVESLQKVGSLKKGNSFDKDVELKLKTPVDPANLRIVAFAQEPGPGRVLGAALQTPQAPNVGH
ncbi:MAG TPA: DUF1223 domain-containing protein [Terriglobales bacterium]|nr:DUF1223 domain-containing protein [Terriglobales bacterium]